MVVDDDDDDVIKDLVLACTIRGMEANDFVEDNAVEEFLEDDAVEESFLSAAALARAAAKIKAALPVDGRLSPGRLGRFNC